MNWTLIGFLAMNFVLSVTGDVMAKVWAVTDKMTYFYIGLGVNVFTMITFMLVVRSGGLSIGSNAALILTMLGNLAIGVLIFKEVVTPIQWVGVALGLVAAFLVLRSA